MTLAETGRRDNRIMGKRNYWQDRFVEGKRTSSFRLKRTNGTHLKNYQ